MRHENLRLYLNNMCGRILLLAMLDKKINLNYKTMVQELKTKAAKFNPQHKEGKVATAIEEQTSKLPSDTFLWASITAMAASLTLKALKKDHVALFVGQWAAPFLLLGVYNKLVKLEGHD
jgi:hypothetical protein